MTTPHDPPSAKRVRTKRSATHHAKEYDRLRGGPTGGVLVAALQASPHRDIELTAAAVRSPLRSVDLREPV